MHHPLSCMRKRKYDNEAEAWSVIFRMRARGQDTERLVPYSCAYGGHWHLGRMPTRMQCELAKVPLSAGPEPAPPPSGPEPVEAGAA